MQYITTTELRTKSKRLVEILREGKSVDLVHRSKVVGEIRPKIYDPKPFDAKAFMRLVKDLNLPRTTPAQRERIYRKHLLEKYGKGIS
ncbi:MAG: hypothetical protein Q8Q15_02090 [bacterium]|nr:hypothetical protein [bacterium]